MYPTHCLKYRNIVDKNCIGGAWWFELMNGLKKKGEDGFPIEHFEKDSFRRRSIRND